MNAWWMRQCSRIDALALRERLLLLIVVLVCCLAAADTIWLSPAQNAQKKLAATVAQENAELATLRSQLLASGQAGQLVDPASAAREQIAQAKLRLDQVKRDIVATSGSTEQGNSLPKVLVQFLRRHEQLTLVRTATLPADVAAKPLGSASASADLPSIRRQGLELTVSGPYLELMNYVRTLELALPTLRWGSMKLNSEKLPPQLTLQVFVVGVQS
jgi:MSHA biogenesis protein MshJ